MGEKEDLSSIDRRTFLKLLGLGGLVAGGTGFGLARHYGIFNTAPEVDFDYKITESHRRPKADFGYKTPERTLLYINPTSAEEILFFPMIVEDDLSYSWFIDSEPVAESTDYSTKLKAGEHIVKLYVKESDERFVELLNKSYDPDTGLHPLFKQLFGISDNLMYEWNVGGQKISNERDYSLKLSSGEHKIGLNVSDDRKQGYTEKAVTIPEGSGNFAVMQKVIEVDPDELYPEKELGIPIKAISFYSGFRIPTWVPTYDETEIREEMSVISKELGCNGIRIQGDNDELILDSLRIAKEIGFKTIILSPRYINADLNQTITNVRRIAEKIESLRSNTSDIILSVGNEITLDAKGLYDGLTYTERSAEIQQKQHDITVINKMNTFLERLITEVKTVYQGKITYCPGEWEQIEWNRLDIDILLINLWLGGIKYAKEEAYLQRIDELTKLGKPVFIEAGSFTYKGARQDAGSGWQRFENKEYSQEEQAKNIVELMELYYRTKIKGFSLAKWVESKIDDRSSNGIVRYLGPNKPFRRKVAFYAFGSYKVK